MLKIIKKQLWNYAWFIRNSQNYMSKNHSTIFYKSKIFLQSLYKGILFCYEIAKQDHEMKKFDEDYYNELIEEKDIIIKFLIEKGYIQETQEYNDFVNMLGITYKLEK